MTAQSSYALFARFYDSYVGDYAADLPFYLSFASRCLSPILEVGCGTGRVMQPLLQAGHTVIGVDISNEMLSLAQTRLKKVQTYSNYLLLNHNFVECPLPEPGSLRGKIFPQEDLPLVEKTQGYTERYGLALVTFYTFNYIPPQQQSDFLKHIGQNLKPGAKLVLHLFFPEVLRHPDINGQWVNKGVYRVAGQEITLRDKRIMLDDFTEERVQVFSFSSGKSEVITTTRYFVNQIKMRDLLLVGGYTNILSATGIDANALSPIDAGIETKEDIFFVAEKT